MNDNLFVYGTLKTGGPRWREYLAPRIGQLAQVDGWRLWRIEGSPAMMKAGPGDIVYGELFRGVPKTLIDKIHAAADEHYWLVRVATKAGTGAWALVASHIPMAVVWGALADATTWRTRDITRGLNRLAREMLADLGDNPSKQDRLALAIRIRDEIRPLVQANWVGIPWRTGPNIPEWKLCQTYMDRLAMAAEIGL